MLSAKNCSVYVYVTLSVTRTLLFETEVGVSGTKLYRGKYHSIDTLPTQSAGTVIGNSWSCVEL